MSIDQRDVMMFAGGDAISRYGVVVKRTAAWEEDPEVLTRAGEATFIDRDGSTRTASTDILCVEWISGSPTLKLHAASTGSTVNADRLYIPWTTPPVASAYYARFKVTSPSTGLRGIFRIGSTASTAGPGLACHLTSTGGVTMRHFSTGAVGTCAVAVAASTGDVVEALLNLSTAGVVRGHVSVNSGTVTKGTASTAVSPLASTWCARKVWIGSLGAALDCAMNLYAFAAARSTQSMANMREIA